MKKILVLGLLVCIKFISAQDYRYTKVLFPSSTATNNVVYGSAPFINAPYMVETNTTIQDLLMDIYVPTGDAFNLRPAIIYAHPGGFLTGNKSVDDMKALCDSFARKGYVTASIDYRQGFNLISNTPLHSTRAVYRGLQDGRTAVRFLRANAATYGIDPTKIYFVGSSAGSFIALHTIYLDTLTEIPVETNTTAYTNVTPPFNHTAPSLGGLDIGGNLSQNGKPDAVISMWGAVQNVNLITASNKTPVFLIHGIADATVSYNTASPFAFPALPQTQGSNPINARLNALGFKAKDTYFVAGQGHEFYGASNGTWSNGTGGNAYLPIIVNKSTQFLWKQHKPLAKLGYNSNSLSIDFIDSSAGSSAWWWDFGDGNTSNAKNPNHVYATVGTYKVKLYIENNIKSWDTISKTIVVTQNNPPIAKNDTFSLNDSITVVVHPRWNDMDVDGDSITIISATTIPQAKISIVNSNKSISFTSPNEFEGEISAQYIISDGKGGKDTANLIFKITDTSNIPNTRPVANDEISVLTRNTTKVLAVLSNDYDIDVKDSIKLTKIVLMPKNGIATIQNSKINYTPNSNFIGKDSLDYMISDKRGLTDIARVYLVVIEEEKQNGLENSLTSMISIYPNPAQHILSIEVDANLAGNSFQISDMQGRQIFKGTVSKSKFEIDLKSYPKGTYTLTIYIGTKIISQNFRKE